MNGDQHLTKDKLLMYDHLPGGEILRNGLKDLQDGVSSIEALLVLVGAPRLTRCGIRIRKPVPPAHCPSTNCFAACASSTARKPTVTIAP